MLHASMPRWQSTPMCAGVTPGSTRPPPQNDTDTPRCVTPTRGTLWRPTHGTLLCLGHNRDTWGTRAYRKHPARRRDVVVCFAVLSMVAAKGLGAQGGAPHTDTQPSTTSSADQPRSARQPPVHPKRHWCVGLGSMTVSGLGCQALHITEQLIMQGPTEQPRVLKLAFSSTVPPPPLQSCTPVQRHQASNHARRVAQCASVPQRIRPTIPLDSDQKPITLLHWLAGYPRTQSPSSHPHTQ